MRLSLPLLVVGLTCALVLVPTTRAQNLLNQADLAFQQRKYERTVELADSLIARDSLGLDTRLPRAYYLKGRALLLDGHPNDAIDAFDESIASDPYSPDVFYYRAKALVALGDLSAALADANEAVRLEATSVRNLLQLAGIHFRLESYTQAVETYNRVLTIDDDNPDAHVYRAECYLRQGNLKGAYHGADEAIQIDPSNPQPYRIKAEALTRVERFSEAVPVYTSMIERLTAQGRGAQRMSAAYNNRGRARWMSDDVDGALQDFTRALQLNNQFTYAYRNRGMVYLEMEKTESACFDFEQALQLGFTRQYGNEVKDLYGQFCGG